MCTVLRSRTLSVEKVKPFSPSGVHGVYVCSLDLYHIIYEVYIMIKRILGYVWAFVQGMVVGYLAIPFVVCAAFFLAGRAMYRDIKALISNIMHRCLAPVYVATSVLRLTNTRGDK